MVKKWLKKLKIKVNIYLCYIIINKMTDNNDQQLSQCFECKKKLGLLPFQCKCKNIYCSKHRLDHKCTFDYKQFKRDQLEKEMVKVTSEKLIKI